MAKKSKAPTPTLAETLLGPTAAKAGGRSVPFAAADGRGDWER